MQTLRPIAVVALVAACGARPAPPRVSSDVASALVLGVGAHLGDRTIDIVLHGTYGRGLAGGSGRVVVVAAPASRVEAVLQAAPVDSWTCNDGLCVSQNEVDLGTVACVMGDGCGDPTADDLAPHIGGAGVLVLVFEGTSDAPVLAGVVLGDREDDARAALERARD